MSKKTRQSPQFRTAIRSEAIPPVVARMGALSGQVSYDDRSHEETFRAESRIINLSPWIFWLAFSLACAKYFVR
jgi:hypothetical protein